MIELSREEYNSLRCQNGTIENGRGEHSKYLPFDFAKCSQPAHEYTYKRI